MSDILHHYIGGDFRAAPTAATRERRNPSRSTDLVAVAPVGDATDVGHAVAAAAAAAASWRATTGPARAELLYRLGEIIAQRSEAMAETIAREVGKPIGEARGEVGRASVICRYYAGEAVRAVGQVIPAQTPDTLQYTIHDPVGPVALIAPWNFPLAIPLWKAAPALAFGNTVVLKPSELSPRVAHELAEAVHAAGFPAGVFNMVHGDGTTGAALIDHDAIRGVSFTGSQAVGARITAAAAARGIRCQAEMGGKNVVIVMADADLDRAAALTAAGAFRFAGQKCTATSRVIVADAVRKPFLDRLAAATAGLTVGPVMESACAIGPLVTAAALERTTAALATAPGERLFGGGLPADGDWAEGNWFAPCAVAVDDPAHPLAQQELFAPVLTVLRADDLDHAIAIANATPFGLSASLFTRDLHTAMHYARQIEVGLVRINGDTTGVDPHAPFGGVKGSSLGSREQGPAAREFYTESRTIQLHA
ncbi:MAG: aldehyde dehydrogenase family protein [Gemmatimonadales bacterium]|nr:aldehyde dehydrogenase family protein [Gemmatimonadales bacterium]